MPMKVKVLHGREHIMSVEEAAQRLQEFGLRAQGIEDLRCPYEIEFPFSMGARDRMGDHIITIKGTYPALRALQES